MVIVSNYIRAKRQKTSEAWINSIFLVMNLMILLRRLIGDLVVEKKLAVLHILKRVTTQLITLVECFYFQPRLDLAIG